jgi:hypothetical protein
MQFMGSFICGVFNNTAINSDFIALNDRCLVNNELEKMWKEPFVV